MQSWAVVVLLACGLVASCGGPPDDATTPRERRARNAEAVEQTPARAADYEDENSVGMEERRVTRWRWNGARKDCFFVVGNRCFETLEEACKAAGCERTRDCRKDGSAPVQVSCPKRARGD